jgi:hypothetical protein
MRKARVYGKPNRHRNEARKMGSMLVSHR